MTVAQIARKVADAFEGSLSEKDAVEWYVERTLKNRPLTDENIECYSRLGVNYGRSLREPRRAFG
jgi:hypothetical protein